MVAERVVIRIQVRGNILRQLVGEIDDLVQILLDQGHNVVLAAILIHISRVNVVAHSRCFALHIQHHRYLASVWRIHLDTDGSLAAFCRNKGIVGAVLHHKSVPAPLQNLLPGIPLGIGLILLILFEILVVTFLPHCRRTI